MLQLIQIKARCRQGEFAARAGEKLADEMREKAHRAYHEHLLGRMADVLGLDLDREVDLTRLSTRQLARAVTRCTECADPDGCELWLEEHEAGSDEAPPLCRNKKLLEHLRGGF